MTSAAARGLDHLVHAVRDLDAAAESFRRLGFQVGAENRHPFGTKNRLIQLPGFFIELLALGDHAPIEEHAPRRFSFGAFNRDFLARHGDGPSMLVFESRDAKADARDFAARGVGDFDPFFFQRLGRRPDGSPVEVAFELAFAVDPAMPDAAFFTCEQKFPENFWSEAAQQHPNGALGVEAVTLVAPHPAEHAGFLATVSGAEPATASTGIAFDTPRGRVDVMTPEGFTLRIGIAPAAGAGLRALTLRLRDVRLLQGDLPAVPDVPGEALLVQPELLEGLTLILV